MSTPLATAPELPTTSHSTAEGEAWNTAFGYKEDDKNQDSTYECSICLDTAENAVVSMCGHLFCWPCLHQWLAVSPSIKLCPVCKSAVDEDKVIPLYGRNSTKQEDPRHKIPPRPAGQRTEPEPQTQPHEFQGFIFGSFRIPFGIESFILLCVYIFIITIYLIVSVTLRVFRPKYKDVLHSNKNPKIFTK